ncbi:rhodanese-like domain-containing protein [Miniphocaeibacter massiliensis]|uniref:rhodanese-like domain-containing protein n=1 Tax=Miniphocaeibacter massiliensis TaxID=2041841 RepID=UPI000C06DE7C|nr:rhodanese-like domain-containing protein [Miniphocaeibacter massiliensis]
MKKKLLILISAIMMITLFAVGCDKKDGGSTKGSDAVTSKDGYQYISAEEAVKIAEKGEDHILDVREWDNYVEGRLINSEWKAIFPLEDTKLEEEMATYAKEKLSDGKKIYIVCNSGKKGAEKTTDILKKNGIDSSLIFTVEGGAKALGEEKALSTDRVEENIEWKYVSAEDALNNKDAQIIDVRDDENYKKGHLKDSIHSDLTDVEDAKLQTNMYKLGVEKLDKEKPVYILCYSGNKCAKTGISVLRDAGFDTNNVLIIEDGAKDKTIQEAFVEE